MVNRKFLMMVVLNLMYSVIVDSINIEVRGTSLGLTERNNPVAFKLQLLFLYHPETQSLSADSFPPVSLGRYNKQGHYQTPYLSH